jgi:pimeloyl-ACP methyl ester carboxylesterase
VLLNKHLWRHQLAGLSDIRRCIAIDLLAHGDTEIAPEQDVSVTVNAEMLKEVLDAMQINQVDVVGNDSGGGIAQIFAALNPERVRSLTLTNCDTHDNWPPEAFKPFAEMVAGGGLSKTLNAMLNDKSIYRSPGALGPRMSIRRRLPTKTSRSTCGHISAVNNAQEIWSVSSAHSTISTPWRSSRSCESCSHRH